VFYFLVALTARIAAPLARSVIGAVLGLTLLVIAVRLPAELWKRYVGANSSRGMLDAITIAWFAIILGFATIVIIRRWTDRRVSRALRRELLADLRERRMARR
jgi:hypothetical protein